MSRYRIEVKHGRHLLCGGIIPADMVKHGQTWVDSSGNAVRVSGVRGDWVGYTYSGINGPNKYNEKENFAFQCRYCLETSEIPEELR